MGDVTTLTTILHAAACLAIFIKLEADNLNCLMPLEALIGFNSARSDVIDATSQMNELNDCRYYMYVQRQKLNAC